MKITWPYAVPVSTRRSSPIIPQSVCAHGPSCASVSSKGRQFPSRLSTLGLTERVYLMRTGSMDVSFAIYEWRAQWSCPGTCRACWNRKCSLIGNNDLVVNLKTDQTIQSRNANVKDYRKWVEPRARLDQYKFNGIWSGLVDSELKQF